MFNMQSGLHRQQFPSRSSRFTIRNPSSNSGRGTTGEKHNKGISGLMIDALNQTVVSAGLDGRIKVTIFS